MDNKQKNLIKEGKLDKEWVELIQTALEMGIPKEEIRNFISINSKTINISDQLKEN